MSKARDFLDAVRGYTQQPAGTRVPAQDRPPKMGTVDPSYTGTGPAKVKFDGEAAVSTKAYVCVNCVPVAGDRVVLIPVGKTLAIIGTIGGGTGYRLVQTVYFAASGTLTKATYPWLRAVKVRVQAGGGAGGGAPASSSGNHASGGGGAGGGYAEAFITNIAGLSAGTTVTVGAAGTASSGANGGNGGDSSFGTAVVATGGGGGGVGSNSALTIAGQGGTPGAGTTGDLLVPGQPGQMGGGGATLAVGAPGGGSVLGAGGRGVYTGAAAASTAGDPATGYGGGGGGGGSNQSGAAVAGGAGKIGLVIVELYA